MNHVLSLEERAAKLAAILNETIGDRLIKEKLLRDKLVIINAKNQKHNIQVYKQLMEERRRKTQASFK